MLLRGRICIALGPRHFVGFHNLFLPNIGEDQKKFYHFSWEPLAGTQARSQKFAMGGCFGGLGPKPPAAGGWGSEGGAPSARKFCIFLLK